MLVWENKDEYFKISWPAPFSVIERRTRNDCYNDRVECKDKKLLIWTEDMANWNLWYVCHKVSDGCKIVWKCVSNKLSTSR